MDWNSQLNFVKCGCLEEMAHLGFLLLQPLKMLLMGLMPLALQPLLQVPGFKLVCNWVSVVLSKSLDLDVQDGVFCVYFIWL